MGERASVLPHRMGDLEMDPLAREVRRGGVRLALTDAQFEMLRCLIEAGGRVVSRAQIRSEIWGPEHGGTSRTVDNLIVQLRTKIGDGWEGPRRIVTVRGVGYRFVV